MIDERIKKAELLKYGDRLFLLGKKTPEDFFFREGVGVLYRALTKLRVFLLIGQPRGRGLFSLM